MISQLTESIINDSLRPPREISRRFGLYRNRLAIIDQTGKHYSFQDLLGILEIKKQMFGKKKQYILLEANMSVQALCCYLAALDEGHPTLLIDPGSKQKNIRIHETFPPNLYIYQQEKEQVIDCISQTDYALHPDLALLLSTSGSTGEPKLVKLSHENLISNAESITKYLAITPTDRAITALPFHYSYGLSVVNSHLLSGASIVLCDDSVSDDCFWETFNRHKCTSFAGVPYTFEILEKKHFSQIDTPTLRYFTQAGGRLNPRLVKQFVHHADVKKAQFFVMYGQTEATARIAYVPPSIIRTRSDLIGIPIPGGTIKLINEQGELITQNNTQGELVYEGPNVMMGYAQTIQDFAKSKSIFSLKTGDIAIRTEDQLIKIVGRVKSFVKLFGLRINLDDLQTQLENQDITLICSGNDDLICIATDQENNIKKIESFLIETVSLPAQAFEIISLKKLPTLSSGKEDRKKVTLLCMQARRAKQLQHKSADLKNQLILAYQEYMSVKKVSRNDSFVSLGGDSLAYVAVTTQIQKILGWLPKDWQNKSIYELSMEKTLSNRPIVAGEVLLRCLAIISVVLTHAHVVPLHGGATLLLCLAGYNFVRFQYEKLTEGDFLAVISPIVQRIIIPFYLITIVYLIYKSDFYLPVLTLVSNYFGGYNGGVSSFITPYWFIEVYFQIVLICCACLWFKTPRSWLKSCPFRFSYALFFIGAALRLLLPMIWDTSSVFNRVPHMLIFLFFLGWCAYFSNNFVKKGLTFISALIILCFGNFSLTTVILFGIAFVILLWVKNIYVGVQTIANIVNVIANSSFSIYLLHGIPITIIYYKFGINTNNPWLTSLLASIVAIVFSIGADTVWTKTKALYYKNL